MHTLLARLIQYKHWLHGGVMPGRPIRKPGYTPAALEHPPIADYEPPSATS